MVLILHLKTVYVFMAEYSVLSSSSELELPRWFLWLFLGSLTAGLAEQDTVVYFTSSSSLVSDSQSRLTGSLEAHAEATFS